MQSFHFSLCDTGGLILGSIIYAPVPKNSCYGQKPSVINARVTLALRLGLTTKEHLIGFSPIPPLIFENLMYRYNNLLFSKASVILILIKQDSS
jgi:hypothetical protein